MFRRLRTLLITGFSTLAVCIGAGFSYWIYNEFSNREIKSGAEIEDIYENYNAGKPNPIDQYEMYLFPSTWYLSQYKDSNSLPEKKYGYIDRKLNDKGEIVDTFVYPNGGTTVSKTNKAYVPINVTDKYCYDIDNYEQPDSTNYKTFKKPKAKEYEPQFESKITGFPKLFDGYTLPTGQAGWNDYSDPIIDEKDNKGVNPNATDGDFQEGEGNGKPIYQQLNIDDRLGYWYDLSATEGRFLPIKLSFSGSISPETFSKLVRNPRADMGDANAWHNYSFGNWLFFNHNSLTSTEKPYIEPIDGFGNYDKMNLFDVLSNLENMSVKNSQTGKYEIRLFASFNNGKDYKVSARKSSENDINKLIDNESPNFLGEGFRDGLKVDYKTKINTTEGSSYEYQTRYFTFQKGDQKQLASLGGKDYYFNTATINNFNTDDKTLSYIDFSGTHTTYHVKNEMVSFLRWEYWLESDYGEWSNSPSSGIVTTFNPDYSAPEDNKNNRTLFSSGDYNIYAIGFDKRYKNQNDAKADLNLLVENMRANPTENIYIGLSGSIKGRQLSPILNQRNDNFIIMKDGKIGNKTGLPYRAYALFYERILDLKIINDVPVSNIPVGQTSTSPSVNIYEEVNEGDLRKHYEKVYDVSRNLFLEDNKFYLGTRKNFDFIPQLDSNGKPISVNSTNKFIYKIDSLDLTNPESLFSNIRIEKEYSVLSRNVEFDINPIKDGSNMILYEHNSDQELTGNGRINGDESNTFVNASEYIEYVQLKEKNNPNTYNAFKLKEGADISPYGFYSIITIFNPTPDHPFKFDIYVYKQKNLFVKIFDERPLPYKDNEPDVGGFLNHDPQDVEYYFHLYDYNISINGKDQYTSSQNLQENLSIGSVFNLFCTKRHSSDTTTTDQYYKDDLKDGVETYYLIDHVTRIIIAKATYSDKGFDIKVNSGTLLNIKKNHVLYVVSNSEYEADEFNPLNPKFA